MQQFEREIILDTETTGLEHKDGHRIIEVAAVEVIGTEETGRRFHRYYHPDRDIPEEASNIHGITLDKLEGKPFFSDEAAELAEFLSGATLVIHNAPFDVGFLKAEFGWAGIEPTWARVVDTLDIARRRYPGQSNKLDSLCDRFSVDRKHRDVHGGLVDVMLLFQVYVKMMGRDQLIPIEDPAGGPSVAAAVDAIPEAGRQSWFPSRAIVAPTDEEMARHAAFMGKVLGGKPGLWDRFGSV